MSKKLLLVLLASVFLGGCSLNLRALMGEEAATDTQEEASPDAENVPADSALQAIPSPGTGTDTASLERDLDATVILDEDFSDLE